MSWTKFAVAPKTSAGTGISVALRQSAKSAAKMNFIVSSARAAEVNWSDGDKLEVMLGEAEHHGLVRVRKNNSIGTAAVSKRNATRGGHYFTFTLGVVPAYVDRNEPKRWARNEAASDAWVEITLPSWAAETAPGKAVAGRPAVPASVAEAANFRRPSREVTGRMMGDPPPDRSALAARSA